MLHYWLQRLSTRRTLNRIEQTKWIKVISKNRLIYDYVVKFTS